MKKRTATLTAFIFRAVKELSSGDTILLKSEDEELETVVNGIYLTNGGLVRMYYQNAHISGAMINGSDFLYACKLREIDPLPPSGILEALAMQEHVEPRPSLEVVPIPNAEVAGDVLIRLGETIYSPVNPNGLIATRKGDVWVKTLPGENGKDLAHVTEEQERQAEAAGAAEEEEARQAEAEAPGEDEEEEEEDADLEEDEEDEEDDLDEDEDEEAPEADDED